ncbi:hypothetical protein HPB50_011304 [Hyalomma asiaticum]|uniref:Uncharacterized protein n=1 Tax=Hyalomma asiaticum TaxID=266040 RepID=A0ACB7RVM3_HYAAI|nr:hypothetical protein HPB50_011304 [Hyalomma asiaticum]
MDIFGSVSGRIAVLRENKALKELPLNLLNWYGQQGCRAFFEALASNASLKTINAELLKGENGAKYTVQCERPL